VVGEEVLVVDLVLSVELALEEVFQDEGVRHMMMFVCDWTGWQLTVC